MKRCPNGSRRNKSTKKCEPKNKSTKKSTSAKKCSQGVPMPPHRIEKIIKMEKQMASVLEEQPGLETPEYYERMKKYLEGLCFPRDTKWSDILVFSVARYKALNA